MRTVRSILFGVAASMVFAFPTTQPSISFAEPTTVSQEEMEIVSDAAFMQRFMLLGEILWQIQSEYVDEPDGKKVFESAINGILGTLDPHSSYMDQESFDVMRNEVSGKFGGIGLQVTMDNGSVKVVAPIDGTPAAHAGIQAGDVISEVDGQSIQGLTINQAVEKMRGAVDSFVTLTIVRPGQREPTEMTLRRAVIHVKTVISRNEEDIGYIHLSLFGETSSAELLQAISKLANEIPADKLQGFVLDLRNNPGGLLDQAVKVSDLFLKNGKIVSVRGRGADDVADFRAYQKNADMIGGKPLIVLINGASASASEIVAGALQDQRRATIIGTRSFGKGSVQTVIPLGPGNGALRLTTARYYTPSGNTIQARGITPDIEVLQDVPEELKGKVDTEGESSLKGHLKTGDEERAGSQAYVPPDKANDKALNRAFELLRGEIADPAFPAKGETEMR